MDCMTFVYGTTMFCLYKEQFTELLTMNMCTILEDKCARKKSSFRNSIKTKVFLVFYFLL